LADFLTAHPEHHLGLGEFYQAKWDYFCGLLNALFSFVPTSGTYLQLLNYFAITQQYNVDLVRR